MSTRKRGKTPPPLNFGPLPVDAINVTLGFELEPGDAILTANAQVHASRRHPIDYPMTLPHVGAVIANPLYLGDDFKNHDKIELVGRVPALGSGLLVCVNIEPDRSGNYEVVSFYPVSETKISNRREKGRLKNVQRKR